MRSLWLLLAGHRDYRLLVGAGLVSALGDYVLGVGLTYLVYDMTGSTVASAAMLVVSVLPQVLLASAAGVLVDRWDRRRTLAVTYLLQVAVLAPLLVVTDDSRLWVLYLVAAAAAVVEQLSTPAEQALVPHLVPVEDLVPANAINGQSRNVARLVGSGLGGVTAAWGGLPALAVVDAVTFLLAAWLVLAIRARTATAAPADGEAALPTPWWVEWRAGLAVAAGSRTLRVLLLFTAATAVGEGVMGTLFPAFVRDVLDSDARGYGVVVGRAGHRWRRRWLAGGRVRRAMAAGTAAGRSRGRVRPDRPHAVPLSAGLGAPRAGGGADGGRRHPRRSGHGQLHDLAAARHDRRLPRPRLRHRAGPAVRRRAGRLAAGRLASRGPGHRSRHRLAGRGLRRPGARRSAAARSRLVGRAGLGQGRQRRRELQRDRRFVALDHVVREVRRCVVVLAVQRDRHVVAEREAAQLGGGLALCVRPVEVDGPDRPAVLVRPGWRRRTGLDRWQRSP